MKEKMFERFKSKFPFIAEDADRYYAVSKNDLTIVLQNGDRILYDDFEKVIRNLPRDNMYLSEQECCAEFGKRLRKIMFRKNVTQYELSELTGISRTTISFYINGKTTPSFYNADKIAKALKCSVDEFRYT